MSDHHDDLTKMVKVQAVQGEKIEGIEETCKEIKHCLLGNGKPGLVVRTDRLEQREAFKNKLFWVFATAVVALVVKTIGLDIIGAIARASGQ